MGAILSPAYWTLAGFYRAPGLPFRMECAAFAFRLLLSRKRQIPYRQISAMVLWPIDSVRYFEFDFIWQILSESPFYRYLDVSSPRMFPIILVHKRPNIAAELLNPDESDLSISAALVQASGMSHRCHLRHCLIENAPFEPESFDAITSISVIEHIPDDTNSLKKIWSLLKPGGRLLLSLPCAAEAEEEYRNVDYYGVQCQDERGYFFHQYKYDVPRLEERIYSVTGVPRRFAVFGERKRGTLQNWLVSRWTGGDYPLWKEPYAVARQFRYYQTISELPGDGVVAMEFVKP